MPLTEPPADRAPYWIVVWREPGNLEAPEMDAYVFRSGADMIAEIADGSSWRCDDRVLDVFRVSPDGPVAYARDDLDRVFEEHLADWEAERQHRAGLRAGAR